ncbi:MAG: hypothetical protein QXL88_00425 [Candidatus Pacearchaeota archaeon]
MFEADEIILIAIASTVLGFFLSLFYPSLTFRFVTFIIMSLLVFVMFFIFTASQKMVAHSLDCKAKIKLLTFSRYGFKPEETLGFEFPLWFILPLIFYFITAGKFLWTAILNFEPEALKTKVRRKFPELTEEDIAKIAVSGPLALLIFGLIMRLVHFNSFAYLCILTAFLAFLPLGSGAKIYAGMRITGVFLLVLSLAILLLMPLLSVLVTILIALVIAIIFIITYYVLWER